MDFMNYIVDNKLILVPVLYIVGMIIKNTSLIKDKYIPVILLGLGIILSIFMGGDTVVSNIIQGVLVAGVTVMTNQMIKQSTRGN